MDGLGGDRPARRARGHRQRRSEVPRSPRLRRRGNPDGDRRCPRRRTAASTISQQTAKNLFLWPGRSLFRKGLEAYLTILIELCWNKQRIVEVYLNVAEFGDGLFGITAASERFFGKAPAELTADDAALLAAVLPSPGRLRADDPSPYVQERQAWIRRHMRQLGGVDLIAALE